MSISATDISDSLAGALSSASPSIVHIDARDHLSSSGIVWADDVIVTAAHTVRDDSAIDVRFDDGSSRTATLAGRDDSCDVAVLRTSGKKLVAPSWRDASELRVGHLAIAAGRPGRTLRATAGIISGIGPEWRTHGGTRIDRYVDVDAALPPGFSGGPLLDASGRFIGMNTSRVVRTGTTIPHETLARIVPLLLAHGTAARPSLGIAVYPVEAGLLVISVKSGSAADAAGMIVGDIIRSVEGQTIQSPRDLHHRLRDAESGAQWTIVVSRGGMEKTIAVTPR
ncbi:MAG: S1C family serine protease [Thermoanaerobaculia bacterium]